MTIHTKQRRHLLRLRRRKKWYIKLTPEERMICYYIHFRDRKFKVNVPRVQKRQAHMEKKMVRSLDGMSWNDWNEEVQVVHTRFKNKEIEETEYRKLLARYGFNATEIEAEILARRMEDF